MRHDWPGNVRELRNVVEMVCLLRSGKQVRLRDRPEGMQQTGAADAGADPRLPSLSIQLGIPLERNIERIIEATLGLEHGNRSRAAERLRVSVRTIQRYLARGVLEAEPASEQDPARRVRAERASCGVP